MLSFTNYILFNEIDRKLNLILNEDVDCSLLERMLPQPLPQQKLPPQKYSNQELDHYQKGASKAYRILSAIRNSVTSTIQQLTDQHGADNPKVTAFMNSIHKSIDDFIMNNLRQRIKIGNIQNGNVDANTDLLNRAVSRKVGMVPNRPDASIS
mgnify:CR=1 FL=1